ncbi:hypothetical protein GCM10027565_48490 [Bordetella tumulicola]
MATKDKAPTRRLRLAAPKGALLPWGGPAAKQNPGSGQNRGKQVIIVVKIDGNCKSFRNQSFRCNSA